MRACRRLQADARLFFGMLGGLELDARKARSRYEWVLMMLVQRLREMDP